MATATVRESEHDRRAPTSPRARRRLAFSMLLGLFLTSIQIVPVLLFNRASGPELAMLPVELPHNRQVLTQFLPITLLQVVCIPLMCSFFERRVHKFGGGAITFGVIIIVVTSALLVGLLGLVTMRGMQAMLRTQMTVLLSACSAGIWALSVFVPTSIEREAMRESALRASQLESGRLQVETELARLRSRTQPHFLLNTLSVVSALIGRDVDAAREVIADLGDLLRASAMQAGETTTVGDELAWLRRYVRILQVRHGSLLQICWHLDERALSYVIPSFILQPLVENAVQHGVMARAEGGQVQIHARLEPAAHRLCLEVVDNGPGFRGERPGGVGLGLVRRKLELFGRGSSLQIVPTPVGGVHARIELSVAAVTPGERALS
jgi:signal transduction histidine kinase